MEIWHEIPEYTGLYEYDCPMCYIENKTLQFAEVNPNFYCAAGRLKEQEE